MLEGIVRLIELSRGDEAPRGTTPTVRDAERFGEVSHAYPLRVYPLTYLNIPATRHCPLPLSG